MNYCSVKPRNKLRSIPVPNIILMRNNYNQLHLFTPNRLELQLLIACTSVGHAALVTIAVLIPTLQKSERLTNHTRSIVPRSANANFQRIHSQAMILTRGLQTVFPVIAAWRPLASLTNLALPPAINLVGKLFVVISIFSWSFLSLFFFHIASSHSLSLFIVTRRGKRTYHVSNLKPSFPRENTVGMEPAWTWEKRFSSPKAKDRLS